MVAYASRDAWTSRRPQVASQQADRLGTAVHWLGMNFDGSDHSACLRVLHSIEEQDVRDKGFAALPYNEVACRHGGGTRIEGRGRGTISGANGSAEVNQRYGSVCALVGVDEQLTDAEWDALHAAILESAHLQAPGKPLLTHNQVRPDPTACPGPDLTAWIEAGCPPPPVPVEDDMPLTPEDIKRIWTSPVGGQAGQPGWWQQLNKRLDEIDAQNAEIKAALDALAQK